MPDNNETPRINDILGELLAQEAAAAPEGVAQDPTQQDAAAAPQSADNGAGGQIPMQGENGSQQPPQQPTQAPAAAAQAQPQQNNAPMPQDPQEAAAIGLERAAQALAAAQQQNAQLTQQLSALLAEREQTAAATQTSVEGFANAAPVIDVDLSDLAYLSDEERAERLNQLYSSIEQKTRSSLMSELEPVLNDYKTRQRSAEDEAVKTTLANQPQFRGFRENESAISNIIASTPELAELPPEKKYTLAYLINRGVESMNRDNTPETPESIAEKVAGNSEAMRLIELRRAQGIAQSNSSVPILSAAGSTSVPATVDAAPQTLAQAREKAMKMLG